MNKLAKTLAVFGTAGIIMSGAIGTAMAEESTQSEVTQAAAHDQGNGGYYAEAVGDHTIKVTLSNASFRPDGKELQVVNSRGEVVETLGSKIQASTGQKVDAHYEMTSDSEVLIHFDNPKIATPGGWGDYAKCVGKGTLAGAASGCAGGALAGGAGCLPGAGVGAVTGGVGSLVGCW